MSSWRDSQPLRLPKSPLHPNLWLCAGLLLSLVAAQGMKDAVPLWTVALCVVAALSAGVAGRRAARSGGAAAIFGVVAVGAVALSMVAGLSWSVTLLVIGLACLVPWFGGRYLYQQDELACEANQRIRLQERSRIAQDMHDSLGHELNLIALRAGAFELDTTMTPPHRAAATELRAGAASAITQLTAVIGLLRDDAPVAWGATSPDIADLIQRTADAGMNITFERNGPRDAAAPVARCIYRVVQEGITNAARHAPGSAVTVSIDSSTDATRVTVTNTAPSPTLRRSPGSRTGFVALQEQLQACSGTFSARPHHGGFRLTAHIPHAAAG